jgi:hypothetical protein
VDLDSIGIAAAFGLAALFIAWYFIGAAINRRRIADAARWVNRGLEAFKEGGQGKSSVSIKWLATNAFNILLEGARPPFRAVVATVLLQSRDMVTVWMIDRVTGRRDILLLRCDLRKLPIWGLEVFRPRSILSGDARQRAKQEDWPVELSPDGTLLVAHGGGKAGQLCASLLREIGNEGRCLIRLGISRRSPHLMLAIDLPDPARSDPRDTLRLAERLAAVTGRYSTS